jgi:hypothetical protein
MRKEERTKNNDKQKESNKLNWWKEIRKAEN